MAFVFRSPITSIKQPQTPGPGQYRHQVKQNDHRLSSAPFNQASSRKIWKENHIPGVGTYSLQQSKNQRPITSQSAANIYAIFQSQKQSSNFKSNSKRFDNNHNEMLPSPCQYSCEVVKSATKVRNKNQPNSLQKYLQLSKGQIRSKKDQLFAVGQQEAEINRESMAQSCYINKPQRKIIPFCSSVGRMSKVRPQTSVGPGTYEVNRSQSRKQVNNRKCHHSIKKFKKINNQFQLSQEIQQQQFSQNNIQKTSKKSFNSKKEDFFGSKVARFKKPPAQYQIGPGQYEIIKNSQKKYTKTLLTHAFWRSSPTNQKREIIKSPFVMRTQPQANINKQILKKKANKNQGYFGSKEARFKEQKSDNNPFVESITSLKNQLYLGQSRQPKRQIAKKQSSQLFMNKRHRLIKKDEAVDLRPLSYDPQINTISSKAREKCQINAPFLSHAARFNQNQYQRHIIEQIMQSNQQLPVSQKENIHKKTLNQPKGLMNSNNPRFNYKDQELGISPCSYDPLKPQKKEFNKLFL